jgi:hypothetical protein
MRISGNGQQGGADADAEGVRPVGGDRPRGLVSPHLGGVEGLDEILAGARSVGLNSRGDDARACQQQLLHLGYELGEAGADGWWGERSMKALRRFQRDVDLPATGLVDRDTLRALDDATVPALSSDRKPALTENRRLEGELFVDGIDATDVDQGDISNCYLAATLAAVAHTDPQIIREMVRVKDEDKGIYEVRFFDKGLFGPPKEVWIEVTDHMPTTRAGSPVYMRSWDRTEGGGRELWPSLVEKAYAKWHGGYHYIDAPCTGAEVTERLQDERPLAALLPGFRPSMRQVTGASTDRVVVGLNSAERLWRKLTEAQGAGHPTKAITGSDNLLGDVTSELFGERAGRMAEKDTYKGAPVAELHNYAIVGLEEQDGRRTVKLRNPHGSDLDLSLEDFRRYFLMVAISEV